MFCTNCGKKVYDGDKFCAHCGTRTRAEAPAPKPVSQDIVFNPPFKKEAERRTNEIYRGFVTEESQKPKARPVEPVNFDWNLDGFPKEMKKTDEIDFNWDSVVERRNQQRSGSVKEETPYTAPVVDKIDLRNAVREVSPEPVPEIHLGAGSGRVRTPLFSEPLIEPAAAAAEMFAEPAWESIAAEIEQKEAEKTAKAEPEVPLEAPAAEPAETAEAPEEQEEKTVPELVADAEAEAMAAQEEALSIAELEEELFGSNYKGIGAMAPEDAVKNTAQLEKFYTYNKKNEEFQQLLDQEYERLQGMENQRRADTESLEFTWATTLFPERKEMPEVKKEPAAESEEKTAEPAETAKPAESAEPAAAEESAPAAEPEKKAGTVPAATIDFSAIREEARQKKQKPEAAVTAEPAEIPAETHEEVPAEVPAEEKKPAEIIAEVIAEEQPAETEKPVETEKPAEDAADNACEEAPASEEEIQDEKLKLRYSDVFPRESAASDRRAAGSSGSGTAARVSLAFDEEEEEEPRKMNFFVKLIITLLVVLILAEGVILLAKFIAPDSGFSQKADVLVETVLDRITGGGSETGDSGDDGEGSGSVSGNLLNTTYITDILEDKIELPDSIGALAEDPALKYDLDKTYSFEKIAETEDFEDGEWMTGNDGASVTYAEGILDAIVSYYGQWQATNKDTSLIGINTLEIGEIRTGEQGYYTLCRLTFAAADGEEAVKYVTAYVKVSQNSMLLNEIKEEKL